MGHFLIGQIKIVLQIPQHGLGSAIVLHMAADIVHTQPEPVPVQEPAPPAAPKKKRKKKKKSSPAAPAVQEAPKPAPVPESAPQQPKKKKKKKRSGGHNGPQLEPRRNQTKDSTEQPSLMKPFYLDFGR